MAARLAFAAAAALLLPALAAAAAAAAAASGPLAAFAKAQRQVMPWATALSRAGGGCGDDNPSNPVCNITALAEACLAAGANAFNSNGFLFDCRGGRCDCDAGADLCMRGRDIYDASDPSVNFGSDRADTYVPAGAPVPPEFAAAALAGRLLWGSPEAAECYMPEVGNGFIASTVGWSSMHVAGLVNGRCGSVEKARLPSALAVAAVASGAAAAPLRAVATVGGALDTDAGVYRRRLAALSDAGGAPLAVEQRFFAHRERRNAIAVEFELLTPLPAGDALTLRLETLFAPAPGGRAPPSGGHVPGDGCAGSLTEDLRFDAENATLGRATLFDAATTRAGDLGEFWNITFAVEFVGPNATLAFSSGGPQVATFLAVVATSLDSLAAGGDGSAAAVHAIAASAYVAAAAAVDAGTFLTEHVAAWAELNAAGIEVDAADAGDAASAARALDVAQHASSSFYFLASSIRGDWNAGVSPGGISSCSYSGAVFVDQDIWMQPGLLFLKPDLAASLVQFRFNSIATERNISALFGYNGTMVAWTAGYDGRLFGCCSGSGSYEDCLEQHVTGGVGWAAWEYYAATGDDAWLASVGFPVLAGAADFHASRVTPTADGNYSIKGVLPIDEWCVGSGCGCETPGVDDDAWQNAIARVSLLKAAAAAAIVNDSSGRAAAWARIGAGINLLWNASGAHHNQFTSEQCPGGWGGSHYEQRNTVCPEDVNLAASYPLGDELGVPLEVAEKDALLFAPLTCRENAGMTTPMHAIMWLGLSELQADRQHGSYAVAAERELNRSMHAACYGPFLVRNEVDKHADVLGAHYDNAKFLTGDGGFLQALLNGYGGLRLFDERTLKLLRPHLPDDVGALRLRRVAWHGRALNYTVALAAGGGGGGGALTASLAVDAGGPLAATQGGGACAELVPGGATLSVDAACETCWPLLVREGAC
jgi:hypothetical protein